MKGYTKLHAKIVMSSIWRSPDHVRLLWITMLALANEDGVVEASLGGLADMARLSLVQTKDALVVLMSPDADSSDGTTGERIEPCPGGWLVLNHANYRDKQTRQQALTAERVRRHRERRRQEKEETVTPNECNAVKRPPASASACASVPNKKKVPEAEKPEGVGDALWQEWLATRKAKRWATTQRVLDGALRKGAAEGLDAVSTLTEWLESGYQGFFPDRRSQRRTARQEADDIATHPDADKESYWIGEDN